MRELGARRLCCCCVAALGSRGRGRRETLRDTVEEREKGAKGKEGGRDRRRDIDREGKTNR